MWFFTQLSSIISGFCDSTFTAMWCSINDIMLAFPVFQPMASDHYLLPFSPVCCLWQTFPFIPLHTFPSCRKGYEKEETLLIVWVSTNFYLELKLEEPNIWYCKIIKIKPSFITIGIEWFCQDKKRCTCTIKYMC